jgi:hypothetical protein
MRSLTRRVPWKPALILLALLVCGYLGVRIMRHLEKKSDRLSLEPFYLGHVVESLTYDPRWETAPLTAADTEHLRSVLSQPFFYLGQGHQSYVFTDADGRYVLKCIKYQRIRPVPRLRFFSFLVGPLDPYRLEETAQREKKRNSLYSSWVLAYQQLQPETGLIYVHLNPTDQQFSTTTLVDKKGHRHSFDLDQSAFLLQERVEMLVPHLRGLLTQNGIEEVKQILDRLLVLLVSEYQRGLADNDSAFIRNMGVKEGRPIQIDVGNMAQSERYKDPVVYRQKLRKKVYKLRKWLKWHAPALRDYFDDQLRALGVELEAGR